jgi:outer membrane immunogenic protein
MKLTTLAGAVVATLALAQTAFAADLPRRMPVKAPPVVAPAVFTWTGCYIGAHGGFAWGNKRWTNPAGDFFDTDGDVDGWLVGGQVGCNLQTNNWVVGIEGQAAWADIDGTAPNIGGGGGALDFHSKVDIIGSIALRLGYAVDRTLFYVKGGAAFARDHHWVTVVDSGCICGDSDKYMRWGWMVGGGIEYAFTLNWSIKGEYNYMHLGTKTVTIFDPVNPVFDDFRIKQHIHLFKVGINYRFGPVAGPVVARY